jgi:ferric-dicitrate binding protein FerR (iron transport regulator)
MKRSLIILALLLIPSGLWAQGTLRVLSSRGQVEWKASASRVFVPVTATSQPSIQTGDEVRTGPDAEVILQIPDGSYMVVSENSKMVIEDFWSGNLRSIMNLMVGQVRFYIQRFGGRPNPYSVRTPTALIAVRGTIFDVTVDPAQISEVQCLEGRVTVQNPSVSDREVILDPGLKTLVRPNEVPVMPVRLEAELNRNKVLVVHQKSLPTGDASRNPSIDVLAQDNDRRSRPGDPQQTGSSSRTVDSNSQRAKPTLTFP